MADELDERLPHSLANHGMWCKDVGDREKGEEDADPYNF